VRAVVFKSTNSDRTMISRPILEECERYSRKPNAKITAEEIRRILLTISPEIIDIGPVPDVDELKKMYSIRDPKDLPILYSADMTDSVILVTDDKDFETAEGIKAEIMGLLRYIYEDDFKDRDSHKTRRI